MNKVVPNVCGGWSFCTNISAHIGGRIWMLWNPTLVQLSAIECDPQSINSYVIVLSKGTGFWLTMVYGFTSSADRTTLWAAQSRRRDNIGVLGYGVEISMQSAPLRIGLLLLSSWQR
ncbi:hypothetical protein vseg_013334 [Gypsophila vaccaria]